MFNIINKKIITVRVYLLGVTLTRIWNNVHWTSSYYVCRYIEKIVETIIISIFGIIERVQLNGDT